MRISSYLPVPKADKRLLGVWKSDATRTFADWNWKKGTTPNKKVRFKSFFGKLEVRYTRTKVISKLRYRQWEQARRYAVIGKDDQSVAIIIFGELEIKNRKKYDPTNIDLVRDLFGKDKIEHIHFDKDHYWVSVGSGKNREFFRRVSRG